MLETSVIINQMIIFAVLLLIGYIAKYTGVIDENTLDGLSVFTLKIALPCLIIKTVPAQATREQLAGSGVYIIATFLIYLVLLLFGYVSGKLLKLEGSTFYVHIAQMTFGNSGFLGIPLIYALLGSEGIFYLSIFTIIDQIMIWTLSYYLCSESTTLSFKENAKKLINGSTVALIAALFLIIFNLTIPEPFLGILEGIGGTTKYTSMIYIGGLLAIMKPTEVVKNKGVYVIAVLKMIIAPVILFFIFKDLLHLNDAAVLTYTIIAALPCIVINAIFARNNNSDYEYAVSSIFVTTILFMITLLVVMSFLRGFM